MRSFFPPHIILGVSKHHDLGNQKCRNVGDVLTFLQLRRLVNLPIAFFLKC
jgi:hypothetical protein